MSAKRKSAFSVYKMQRKMAENNENLNLNAETLQESVKIETNAHGTSDNQPSGGKKAKLINVSTEGNNDYNASKNKQFSRASRIRQSIGNIGLNKKRKKKKLNESENVSETDSEKDSVRASKDTVDMSPGIVKAKELSSAGFIHKVTSQSDVAELPRKTFEWLISPVTTEKFFR